MSFPREEIEDAVRRYLATRDECSADGDWSRMAAYFTDDAIFIDPAWGRVEGIDEMKASVFSDAMVGLEDWTYPTDEWAVVADVVLIKWRQCFPGTNGKRYEQSGASTLIYAGDGRFSYEEDLLNMAHVMEDIAASGWQPRGGSMHLPPPNPNRDFSRPPAG